MQRFMKKLFVVGIFALATGKATAQGFTFQDKRVTFRGELATSPQITDQSSDTARLDLLVGQSLSIGARYRWRNSNGDQLILTPGLRTEFFPAQSDLDDADAFVFGEYRTNLAAFDRTQLRLRAGFETNARLPDQRFVRYTAQGALSRRMDNGRSVTYRLRYRYRDQNEGNSFDGFDQRELLGDARFAWSFRNQPLELVAVTPFFDLRNADADNFDSTQVGIRVQARYRLSDDITLTGRASAFARDFDEAFSATYPVARKDRRTSVEISLRKDLSDSFAVFGAIGYENNNSNIPVRDYSGATFRLGFEMTLQ